MRPKKSVCCVRKCPTGSPSGARRLRKSIAPASTWCSSNQMLNRRLEIVRKGLTEAQELAVRQPEDASRLLARVEEDLCLLQRRLRAEVEKIGPLVRSETEEEFSCVAASPVRPH